MLKGLASVYVCRFQGISQRSLPEPFAQPGLGSDGHTRGDGGPVNQVPHRVRQEVRALRRHQEPGLAGNHHVSHRIYGGRHDRDAAYHSLHHYRGQSFVTARQREHVERRKYFRHVRSFPG